MNLYALIAVTAALCCFNARAVSVSGTLGKIKSSIFGPSSVRPKISANTNVGPSTGPFMSNLSGFTPGKEITLYGVGPEAGKKFTFKEGDYFPTQAGTYSPEEFEQFRQTTIPTNIK